MKISIVEVTPEPPPKKVLVEMSIEEARYLRALTGGLNPAQALEAVRITLGRTYSCQIPDMLYKIYKDFDSKKEELK